LIVYLDNAATTKTIDEVVDKMINMCKENYGNPSSLHSKGIEAEKEVLYVKNLFSKILKVDRKEIFFTSGGTESNNLAILGTAKAYSRKGKHIITSSIEHPSVSKVFKALQDEGYEITTISVDSNGLINIDELLDSIREDTILVSIMHVNNEIGTIQPIDKIGQMIHNKNPETIFHVDAIQSFGKMNIYPKRWNIDCLSISGHKIYGPKGIGALYINNQRKIKPIIFGGEQQLGIRSGTENTPGIAGLGVAARFMYNNLEKNVKHMYHMKERLRDGLLREVEDTYVNGLEGRYSAPHILNVRFKDVRGEVLLHALEDKGIFISTGSACSSNKSETSPTLTAIGLTKAEIESSVRFSFSIYNNVNEIDYCINQIKDMVPLLRKFVRR